MPAIQQAIADIDTRFTTDVVPNLFLAPWSWHRYHRRLDEQAMAQALLALMGEHDFAAFQRAGSRRSHSRTTIQDVNIERDGDLLSVEIQASGFLYGMVRLLMGQLIAVGEHRLTPKRFEQRWRECRRDEVREAAPTPWPLPAESRIPGGSIQQRRLVRLPTAVCFGDM